MTEPTVFSVSQLAEYLITRAQGREGRNRLEDVASETNGLDLTIDFAGVTAMTISFADEFLGKFLAALDATANDLTVTVNGLNSENEETVAICLERRDRPVVTASAGHLSVIGDLLLQETFEVAARLGNARAADVATALGITPQNANNRLKRLTTAGALRKSRNGASANRGKEFIYSPPPVSTVSA